ncbi:MAG: DUF445 family protein [Oscillospiraceae bacterium]|nr:DUF445 family protein [Oscillospiraceae bacterium]
MIEILKLLAGPLIGAVIGYFTNDIAVKMLFWPRHEVYVFGHRLPFTPGAIPKGKKRLAKAAGAVVGQTLLTREDIEQQLLSGTLEDELADMVLAKLAVPLREDIQHLSGMTDEAYEEKRGALAEALTNEIIIAAADSSIGDILVEKSREYIRERVRGTMASMFLHDEKIDKLTEPLSLEFTTMLLSEGPSTVGPIVEEKLVSLEQSTGTALLEKAGADEAAVRAAVIGAYRNAVEQYTDQLLARVNIAGVVEEKIDGMSVEELEKLVLEVMKHELNTIVRLGAVIGFVLGLFNLLLR